MFSKRSCQYCRLSKSKCDRAASGCARCERAGCQCIYEAPNKSLRIRNQTNAAERHAIRAWRARAKDAPTQLSQAIVNYTSSSPLELPLATDIETLARNRFIYDFCDSRKGLSLTDALAKDEHQRSDGAEAAFVATSLANFYTRHRDSRVASLATSALGRALSILAESLRSSSAKVTHKMVLMAILLGIHQNINRDQHLVGSWVHHFRGSVHLLDAAVRHGLPETTYANLVRLVEMQALCVSLRAELPFPVSARMRHILASRRDLRSRTLALGACVADHCAHVRKGLDDFERWKQSELAKHWKSLDTKFGELEADLQLVLPYHACPAKADSYPPWYRDVSTKSGGPLTLHAYESEDDVYIWNAERMARIKLQAIALSYGLFNANNFASNSDSANYDYAAKQALVMNTLRLVEDLCASVFYCFSYQPHGSHPISSFEDVAGAKAYALISPLAVASECLRQLSAPNTAAETAEWITHVLDMMRERLGVSEAWCWQDEDEENARSNIERALRFDGDV